MKLIFLSLIFLLTTAILRADPVQLFFEKDSIGASEIMKSSDAVYVPAAAAASLFRGSLRWYPVSKQTVLSLNAEKIYFNPGSLRAMIGEEDYILDVPPLLIEHKLWVPISIFTSEVFTYKTGFSLVYDADAKTLHARFAPSLFRPEITSSSEGTTITLSATKPLRAELSKLGRTLTVTLPKVSALESETISVQDGLLDSIKLISEKRMSTLKISYSKAVSSYTAWTQAEPSRLVVVLHPKQSQLATKKTQKKTAAKKKSGPTEKSGKSKSFWSQFFSAPRPAAAPAVPLSKEPPALVAKDASPAQQLQPILKRDEKKVHRIVIDAGHGGKDSGALGARGSQEKEINLEIALELARELSIHGYEVLMTRDDDTFIPLADRSEMANAANADLFISIHCNASLSEKKEGFEVYFLSDNASDDQAAAIAAYENAVIKLEQPVEHSKKVTQVLSALAQNEFINESSLLSHSIVRMAEDRTKQVSEEVKQANFAVLRGARMPAVLVECGYLTNTKEEKNLNRRSFRSAIVETIAQGIKEYTRQLDLLHQ